MDATTLQPQKQIPLFGPLPPRRSCRPTSHHRTAPTSRDALRAAAPRAGTRAARVLGHLTAAGNRGATRDEIADALGVPIQSLCSVVRALLDAGHALEIDRTRPTRLGRPAAVIIARHIADGGPSDG